MRTDIPRRVLKVGEVADYLRLHASTVYRLVRKGHLPAYKVGRDWRFSVDSLARWIANQQGEEAEREEFRAL